MDVHQDVYSLLKGRTRCLVQMVEDSRSFLEAATREIAPGARPDGLILLLDQLDQNRNRAFTAIQLADTRLNELAKDLRHSPESATAIRCELDEQRRLSSSLRELDDRILGVILAARSALSQDAREQSRMKDTLSKFKSQQLPEQGEGLDQTL